MSIIVRHQIYEDLSSILTNEMRSEGFSIDPNYPNTKAPNSEDSEYRTAWNIAYQYYSILYRDISSTESRPVFWSKELLEKKSQDLINEKQMASIESIANAVTSGKSLRRFMSTSIEKADFEDRMYSSWRIAHLHLNTTPSPKLSHRTELVHFVERSGPVLFVFPDDNGLYFIDIRVHGKSNPDIWVETDFLEILHKNWPDIMEKYRMATKQNYSDPQLSRNKIKILRSKNCNSSLVMSDGTEYLPPGAGIMSGGTSANVTSRTDHLFHQINSCLEQIKQLADELVGSIYRILGVRLSELDILLALDDRNMPVFFEKTQGINLSTPELQIHRLRFPERAA